jgi:hypothetical protein
VQDGEDLFRREEPVRDDAEEKGRHQRRHGRRAVGQTDLTAGEPERLSEVGAHRDEPGSPDEVLEEHHH